MKQTYWPQTDLGLAIHPEVLSAEEVDKITAPENRRCLVSRHHLYWPRPDYLNNNLRKRFREHPFNSVWLPHPQHVQIHDRFVGARPPKRNVMRAFLHEADLLTELSVSVRAVELIDTAIQEERVRRLKAASGNRQRHLEAIQGALGNQYEMIPFAASQLVVSRATELLAIAI